MNHNKVSKTFGQIILCFFFLSLLVIINTVVRWFKEENDELCDL